MADDGERPTRDLVFAETRRALEAAFPPERAAWLLRAIELGWPPTPFPEVKLTRSARSVRVSSFEMHGTYEGVLEGIPDHEPLIEAARRPYGGIPVHLFPPPLRRIRRDNPDRDTYVLPGWRCVAVLRSFEAIEPGSDYSLLRIAWFRDDADPLFPADLVADLDWEKLAEDYEY